MLSMNTQQHESSTVTSQNSNGHGRDGRLPIDYRASLRDRPRWGTHLIVLICIYASLPALQLLLMVSEAIGGDPPNNLGEFQLYHYMTAALLLIGITANVVAIRFLRGRQRIAIVGIGIVGCSLTACLAAELLKVLHTHPAGLFYMTQWMR